MRRRRATGLVVLVALMSGMGVADASEQGLYGGHSQTQRNRRAAFADAAVRLSRLQLPSSAGAERALPRSRLRELEVAMNHADVAARWTVPGTLNSVIGYVRRHPPEGSHHFSSGYVTTKGVITSKSITFAWPPVDEVLADRLLSVSVSSSHPGEVELDAQAESIWLSARPEGERFPASVRSIVLRVGRPHQSSLVRTVTRGATVRRILALFNAVPITQPDVFNCPGFAGSRSFSYRLQSLSGATLAQVRYDVAPRASPTQCDPISVLISGRRQHTLLGEPQIAEIQRLFGIPTSRNYLQPGVPSGA